MTELKGAFAVYTPEKSFWEKIISYLANVIKFGASPREKIKENITGQKLTYLLRTRIAPSLLYLEEYGITTWRAQTNLDGSASLEVTMDAYPDRHTNASGELVKNKEDLKNYLEKISKALGEVTTISCQIEGDPNNIKPSTQMKVLKCSPEKTP